jgi:hypothetical protein
MILSTSDSTGLHGYELYISSTSGKPGFVVRQGDQNGKRCAVLGTSDVLNDSWHFIVGQYNGSTTEIYVDGTKQGTPASCDYATKTIYYGTSETHIGRRLTGDYFKGLMDEVKVYNRALSQDEITYLKAR